MRSFLVKDKHPTIRWGMLPDGIMFEGKVPTGFGLAIVPGPEYIVIDVDRHGKIDGFDNIPKYILAELEKTLNYSTKNNGKHYWLKYTGNEVLPNKTSGKGSDLRTDKGYVVWYNDKPFDEVESEIKETSDILNKWIEKSFKYVQNEV